MRHHRIKSMTHVICGMKAQVARVREDDAEVRKSPVRKGLRKGSVPFSPRNGIRAGEGLSPFCQRSLQMAIRAVPANPRNMSTMPANHHSVSCGPSSICTKNVPRN